MTASPPLWPKPKMSLTHLFETIMHDGTLISVVMVLLCRCCRGLKVKRPLSSITWRSDIGEGARDSEIAENKITSLIGSGESAPALRFLYQITSNAPLWMGAVCIINRALVPTTPSSG